MPQESIKFGDFKLGHVPEIKTLGHWLGEDRVHMETSETRVIAFL